MIKILILQSGILFVGRKGQRQFKKLELQSLFAFYSKFIWFIEWQIIYLLLTIANLNNLEQIIFKKALMRLTPLTSKLSVDICWHRFVSHRIMFDAGPIKYNLCNFSVNIKVTN